MSDHEFMRMELLSAEWNLPPSLAQAHVKRDTEDTTPMLPAMPMMNSPVTKAVVAPTEPVVLSKIVTRGLEEFMRLATDGMQI